MKRVFLIMSVLMSASLAVAGGIMYGSEYTVVEYGSNICEGVRIQTGRSPLPVNAITGGAYVNRKISPMYLKVDSGVIMQKDAGEKEDVDAAVVAAKAAYDAAESNTMVIAMTDWNNSKTNFPDIIKWENRFMLRLGQVNGILMSEGIITNTLIPESAVPDAVATYIIEATNPASSSVGIALDECDKWTDRITRDRIGGTPNGEPVRHYITSH